MWAVAFFCLRCGDTDHALNTLSHAQSVISLVICVLLEEVLCLSLRSCVEFAGYLREYIHSEDQR